MAELSRSTRAEQRATAFTFLGEEVTYRQQVRTRNNKTGAVSVDNTDTTVVALVGEISEQTIKQSGGKYQVGDRRFRVQHSDMPETPPAKATSKVIEGGNTYIMVDYVQSSDKAVWDLICRLP